MIFIIWILYFPALYLVRLLKLIPMWNGVCEQLGAFVKEAGTVCIGFADVLPDWMHGAVEIIVDLMNTGVDFVLIGGAMVAHGVVFMGIVYLLKLFSRLLMKKKAPAVTALVKKDKSLTTFGIVTVGFTSLFALSEYGFLSRSLTGMLIPICAYIVLAVSLNLVVGISGELSLGHAGFMGVGAFVGIIVASLLSDIIPNDLIRLLVAMVCGGVLAGIAGFVIGIPVLRLRGDYLAIVTLAFGEILKNVFGNLYVGKDARGIHFGFTQEAVELGEAGKMILKGPMGAAGVQKIATFSVAFLLILFTLFVVLNMINSKEGRAIKAIRDNRIAAESVGINVTSFKLKAFVTSAFLAGMAGALFGLNYSSVVASQFNFTNSINILVFVVLGGMGNITGSIISTTVLYIVPEVLRFLEDWRMIIYAVVLIVVMLCTWSPKVKQTVQVITTWIKGCLGKIFKKKGVENNG